MTLEARELLPLLTEVETFLGRQDLTLFEPDQAEKLAGRARELAGLIIEADDRLVLGLVGGTGVGKSTLINALAGERISASTDLRPTTDRPVLYRHRENPFSLSSDEEVHVHEAEPLKRVSLVDFPDFDSLDPRHRQILSRHFPSLDLLLWVVDPVKYADQAFFNWLTLAPQARVNSLFVFNKLDELHGRYAEQAGVVEAEIVRDFAVKLAAHAGRDNPEIMALSALRATEGGEGRNQPGFLALTARLDKLAEKKLRQAIKEFNVTAGTRALLADLETAAAISAAAEYKVKLLNSLAAIRRDSAALIQAEAQNLIRLLGPSWKAGLISSPRRNAPWPLNFILFIWDGLTGLIIRRKAEETRAPAWPRPELISLTGRVTVWRKEIGNPGFRDGSAPVRILATLLDQGASLKELTDNAASALAVRGPDEAARLAGRFRWRFRHHLLPLLVLVYPFLPVVLRWLEVLIAGHQVQSDPGVLPAWGWPDLLNLLEILVGLYLLETVYFVFKLDQAAARKLNEMVEKWAEGLGRSLEMNLFVRVDDFQQNLIRDLETITGLSARKPDEV
ncbi:MAG: GTPase domain-containing protein [Thermodesulfobacteriota bacterium]